MKKYSKQDRRIIRGLSPKCSKLFGIFERFEQAEFIEISGLSPRFDPIQSTMSLSLLAFSCLSGDGKTQQIDENLGTLFKDRKKKRIQPLLEALRKEGFEPRFLAILDDCEPERVWGWDVSQEDVATSCKVLIEEARSRMEIPSDWTVKLWSEIEKENNAELHHLELGGSLVRELILHGIPFHHLKEHMRKFPNKKLVGKVEDAASRRMIHYASQGAVLEKVFFNAILLQTETPWWVKDPLYNAVRLFRLPITHPFPEERR